MRSIIQHIVSIIDLQAFYPMENTETVNPGEILTARCTYNSSGHDTTTRIGESGEDDTDNTETTVQATRAVTRCATST